MGRGEYTRTSLNGLCEYCNSRERGRWEEGEGPGALHLLRVLTTVPVLWGHRKAVLWPQLHGNVVVMTTMLSRVRH